MVLQLWLVQLLLSYVELNTDAQSRHSCCRCPFLACTEKSILNALLVGHARWASTACNCTRLQYEAVMLWSRWRHRKALVDFGTVRLLSVAVEAENGIPIPLSNWRQLKQVLDRLEEGTIEADYSLYTRLIQACGHVSEAKRVHALITKSGLDNNRSLANQLVEIFLKCGSVGDAREVFRRIPNQNVIAWTSMIAANAKNGHCKDAMELFQEMQLEGVPLDKVTFITVLQACRKPAALHQGKIIHGWIYEAGFEADVTVGNAVINMYGKCGSLEDACRSFQRMSRRDVISWNAIVTVCSSFGFSGEAFILFQKMQLDGIMPNKVTFLNILTACTASADLPKLKTIHTRILDSGCESDVVVATTLLNMYSKCGSLEDACDVFHRMEHQDLISLNTMIAAYGEHNLCKEALGLFQQLLKSSEVPDRISFLNILGAIGSSEFLAEGKFIHCLITSAGLESDIAVGTSLVDMYSKCGSLQDALKVFDSLRNRDLISWNAMITACAKHGQFEEALQLFQQMEHQPSRVTFVAALSACASLQDLESGMAIHTRILKCGLDLDVLVGNALLNMYSKCGNLEAASDVFDKISRLDVCSWNTMVAAYTDYGHWTEAIQLAQQMRLEGGVVMDNISFVTLLNACAGPAFLEEGTLIHACIIESGLERDIIIRTALLNMYAKCGSLQEACKVFNELSERRDLVSWNAMSSAHVQHGCCDEVFKLFQQMQIEGMKPDHVSFINILTACEDLPVLKRVHRYVVESGFEADVVVGTALLSMYGSFGALEEAEKVFRGIHTKDVVTWNAMIVAYGNAKEALQLYEQMDVAPDKVTFVLLLNACASLAELAEGRLIHARMVELGYGSGVGALTAILNMYGKCGELEEAYRIFDGIAKRDVVAWNAMISGYAQQGHASRALLLFWQMQQDGARPDAITLVSILGACSHAGLVAEGCRFFSWLDHDHGLVPLKEHYGCMIDLFGRAGRLDEAERFIKRMPLKQNSVAWTTLLGACGIHNDVERGRRAAQRVIQMEPRKASTYVALANLYSEEDGASSSS